MKICVISTPIFQLGITGLAGYGGLEQIAWQCAVGLAARGHKVSLVAPDGSVCPGCEVIPIGPPGNGDEKQAYDKYWPRLLEFDCIVDHSWCKYSHLLKGEGRLKAPILSTMHAPVNTMYGSLPPGVDKFCAVCISKDMGAHFEALHEREARVCYNGIDLDHYKPLDVPRSGRFLFLARFSSIKGPLLAIEACRKAGVGLDLIGDTSITQEPAYFDQCVKAAQDASYTANKSWGFGSEEGYQKGIRMIGPATRGETVWFFSQCHALLHPNRDFREPFGLAPVEAQACGAGVIAWRRGAMMETVKHGETGFLVSSVDEIVELIRTRAVDQLNRNFCRDWASTFSVQRMQDRYAELCQEAVSTGGW